MTRIARVRVPASTTNLGAGFDCIGIAVDRWLTVSASIDPGGWAPTIVRTGTLAGLAIAPADDRIVLGFHAACGETGRLPAPGLRIHAASTIPVARGLGSSAAATIAGAVAANALLHLGLSDDEIIRIAAREEGHPDNAAAAVHGEATLATTVRDRVHIAALPVHESLTLILAVPAFRIETAEARRRLPPNLGHSTAARAAALAASLVHGLRVADAALLAAALEDDVLHVPHRRALVTGYDTVVAAARTAGAIGTTLSGSGSALVAVADHTVAPAVSDAMRAAWARAGIDAETFVNPPRVRGYDVMVRQVCQDVRNTHHSPSIPHSS